MEYINEKKINWKYVLIFALVILLFMIPFALQAGQLDLDEFFDDLDEIIKTASVNESNTRIINQIEASANTGGNTAEAGEVVQGEASATAITKTIINGEVVEETNIEKTSTKDASIEIERQIKADSKAVEVHSTTTINGQTENSSYSASLDDQEEDEPETIIDKKTAAPETSFIIRFWVDLFNGLKKLFSFLL